MGEVIHVGILEDNDNMRAHFCRIVEKSSTLSLAFAAETLSEAREIFNKNTCDICLVDLQLPDGNGLEFVADLQKEGETNALILTVLGDRVSVLAGLQAGAKGYLLKDTPPAQIEQAILAVMNGGNPISPQAATHLLEILNKTPENKKAEILPGTESITDREKDILTMFSRGMSYQETADILGIKINTVRDHTKSIYRKLSVHSRNEAIFEALQNGWIEMTR
ncbi:LuxR family two component transcriptional regulator [Litorimonas taeanensis]|uniref:LuxR family two component transcriptional regulator n=1 Tax=Litorimonas taeanensis TaxID=568099 RepID=A0A420WDN2_9PROT|nr:response regulator transcription factor [Litorimonas taeanensis]RKQ69127.1 LuxR family two component transcriptional regulator [Litorimonas taeanensis]